MNITSTDLNTTVYVSIYATSSSKHTKCFAGSETVVLSSGSTISISEVKKGDFILSADNSGHRKFAEVIAVPHDKNMVWTKFIRIATHSGNDIKMTEQHFIMIEPDCRRTTSPSLMAAIDVSVGMCLLSESGLDEVTSVTEVRGAGIYSVVTTEEMIVVNGFVASPFAVNHAVANAYYSIVRGLHSVVPLLMDTGLVKRANLVLGGIVDSVAF
jgi:hypothetical protein